MPVTAFRGVTLRLLPTDDDAPAAVALILDHIDDRALSVPLYVAPEGDEIEAIWKAWGRVLRLAAAGRESDGALREAVATPRRRDASATKPAAAAAAPRSSAAGRRSCCGASPAAA